MSIYEGILHGMCKEASVKGSLARAMTWGIPIGKYTGPAPLGLLAGGGGLRRRFYSKNLLKRVQAGGKIHKNEKLLLSKHLGVTPDRIDDILETKRKTEKLGPVKRTFYSPLLREAAGAMGKTTPRVVLAGGLVAPFTAITSPLVAAGFGTGLIRGGLNRRISRAALLDRIEKGKKLTLSEQASLDKIKKMEQELTTKEKAPIIPGIIEKVKEFSPANIGERFLKDM